MTGHYFFDYLNMTDAIGGDMKAILAFIGFVSLISVPAADASTGFESGLSNAAGTILTRLNAMNQLQGKRISVLGFKDMDSGEGCKSLSVAIANEIDSDINKIRGQMHVRFTTVPRHDLDAIETEYLISKGGSESDIVDRLEGSDILITGMWQDGGDTLNLSIKAVSIKQKNIDELTAVSVHIDKNTMPGTLLACLGGTQVTVERFKNGTINWRTKVIQVKGWGAANKSFPKYVWKKSAEEAAIVDAQTKLLEFVNGLKLHSKVFVKNYQVSSATTLKEIKGRLRYARQIGKTIYPTEDTAEVVFQLNLKDIL